MNYKNKYLKSGILRGFFSTLLIFCSLLVYSQSAINILDLYHESFPDPNARLITSDARTDDSSIHRKAGDITFSAIASPAENLKNETVSLDFADNKLKVQIGTKIIYPDLPFWQLAPIVKFADSPYSVILLNSSTTISKKVAACRFHPAFLDNLLGLRLFQADLLNLTDILWDLPIDAQRRYILADSEQGFTPVRDSTLHQTIYNKLINGGFSSFILTDEDTDFVFEIDESGLKFSGNPYYYFTKTESNMEYVKQLLAQLNTCYDDIETYAKIILKDEYTSALNPRTNLGDLTELLTKHKQDKIFNPYAMNYLMQALNKLDSLNSLTNDDIGIKFQTLNDYSESFKSYWPLLKTFNPLVYSAVENTARWSAFFRFVRKNNPDNWSQFVKKIENTIIKDAPAVQTPTSSEMNYFRYFDERNR